MLSVVDVSIQAQVNEATAKVEEYEAELNALGSITDLNSRKSEITKQMRENKQKLSSYKVSISLILIF